MRKLATVFLLILIESSFVHTLACTTVIVGPQASKSGKPMIWKQRDTGNPSNVIAYIPATETTLAYTALFNSDDVGRRASYGGQNTAGFAIVNNMSYNLATSEYDARNGTVMRLALESCSSVDEFEKFIRNMSPRRCSSNFAVLDSTGACAYIEAADSTVVRYDVQPDGWLVRTNFSFAGDEDGPSGYARYESANFLISHHRGKFDSAFFIDGMGRSFYNDVLGYDASGAVRRRFVYDEDFIARPTTSASLCVDGDVIWAAVGYTPGAMMIPFSVADGENIPACIKASEGLGGCCASNEIANELKSRMHPLPRDGGKKYIDIKVFRHVRRIIRKYERKCLEMYCSGNASASDYDSLFDSFKEEVTR